MPNRTLRDWTDSPKFDKLSHGAESLFTRLIMVADDFGRYYADPIQVCSGCFPRRRDILPESIAGWLDELEKACLIERYRISNIAGQFQLAPKLYLAVTNYRQRLQKSVPKFPPKPGENEHWLPDDRSGPTVSVSSGNTREVETKFRGLKPRVSSPTPPPLPGVVLLKEESTDKDLVLPSKLVSTRTVQAWEDWKRYRRTRAKSKDFHLMFKRQLEWLEQFGEPEVYAILTQSIRNGWQGLFEPKVIGREDKNGPAQSTFVLQRELDRVASEMQRIRGQYEGHQSWSKTDIDEYKALREQRDGIRRTLGLPPIKRKVT